MQRRYEGKTTAELMREYAETLPPDAKFYPQDVVEHFAQKYPLLKPSSVRTHVDRMTTNYTSRHHLSAVPILDDLFFRVGPGVLLRCYKPMLDPPPSHKTGIAPMDLPAANEDADSEKREASAEFAFEAHLRDYLVENLHVLEPGLQVYRDDEDDVAGVEYPIRNRRIDILARATNGDFVVIELKLSRGYDRTVGQILTYIAWVRQDLASGEGKGVRGIIVASSITDEVKAALQEACVNIKLFEYALSFSVQSVGTGA